MVLPLPLAVVCFIHLSIINNRLSFVDGQRSQPIISSSSGRELKEYCELDVLRARCDLDEVILVTEAYYGMFKLGRCVQTDYGYVGCYADVKDYMNFKCAGRRHCEQKQPDPDLNQAVVSANCPKEFKAYLYIDYKCVKDEKQACKSCPKPGRARLTNPSGYISSILSAETQNEGSCGSPRCPWVIVVQPGQIINITLVGFNTTRAQRSGAGSDSCIRYAAIKERANPRESSLCGGGKGEELTYTSVSNLIEVHIVNPDVFNWKHQFLIKYEAIGCADIVPPKAASVTRIDSHLEVECPLTGDRWQLVCVGSSWQGHLGPCGSDQDPQVGAVGLIKKTASSFLTVVPFGVLIAAIIAFLIIVTVLIATVGLVCFKKQQYKKRYRRSVVLPPTQLIDFGDDGTLSDGTLLQKGLVPTLIFKSGAGGGVGGAVVSGDSASGRENKYLANSRKMDARPLPSIPDLRLSGSWKMVAADPGSVAALQRMNSGRTGRPGQARMVIRSVGPDGFRRSSAGPRPGSTCTVYSQTDPHQYFILEPEEPTGTGRDIREMILLQERQTVPRSCHHAIRSIDGSEEILDDIMITSIHEIPMRGAQGPPTLGVSTGPIIRAVSSRDPSRD